MTVTYTAEVASCKKFGCFIKLLGRWRGSIYKIIWMDLILFLALYYSLHLIYIFVLENESKETFESIVYYCASYTSLIPLSFVLGFYVNLVMTRWWEQYITIPWPDSIAVFVSAYVHGLDEGGRLMRRTVMRYVCLCLTMVFTMISPCVKKRFPKMKNLVDAGLLLENEKNIFEAMDSSFPKYPKHWMPIVWAASVITRARKEGRIRDDFAVKTIIDELNDFRGRCGTLIYYDFISIPLVYTQVVTIAVYSFFVCSLLAHQWTDKKHNTYEVLDLYSPIFITLQFFFYMGWLKVAETLINPFGEDDDDFEVNWMIDRNLQVSYLIVDEMHHEHPELVRDQYWDEVYPNELPYESEAKREYPPEPSTAKYDLEDLSKRAVSRRTSLANSIVVNRKTHSSMESALNQRSQRFNEAFQRFLNYSETDATSIKSDVENSIPSVSDIENIEHITSYTFSDQAEFETQLDDNNLKEAAILEPIVEEIEEVSEEVGEEEITIIEEEDGEIETQSSYDSDADFDPFERLRIERQQQRFQKMNDFLERYFSTNFRIVPQMPNASEPKFNLKTEDVTIRKQLDAKRKTSEEERTLNDLGNNENLLTPKIPTEFINIDVNSVRFLIDVENEENLLTPKISNVIPIQEISDGIIKTTNEEHLPEKEEVIGQERDENIIYSDLPANYHPSEPLVTTETHDNKDNILATSTQPISFKESSVLFKDQMHSGQNNFDTSRNISEISHSSPKKIFSQTTIPVSFNQGATPSLKDNISQDATSSSMTQSSPSFPKMQSLYDNFEEEAFQAEKSISEECQNEHTSNEPQPLLKSKATSPLGSTRSVSTQSSSVDDWDVKTPISPVVTREYRVEIERSEDEQNK